MMHLITLTLLSLSAGAFGKIYVDYMTAMGDYGSWLGCPGYPLGYVKREESSFTDQMVNHVADYSILSNISQPLELEKDDPWCRSTQQTGNQTVGSPALKVPLGQAFALYYQEFGFVTTDDRGMPQNGGRLYIYGREALDKPAIPLLVGSFDDGNCYTTNDYFLSKWRHDHYPAAPAKQEAAEEKLMGDDRWCWKAIEIPMDISVNTYRIYFVWDGSAHTGPDQPAEIFTSCMDVDIVDAAEWAESVQSGAACDMTDSTSTKDPAKPTSTGISSPSSTANAVESTAIASTDTSSASTTTRVVKPTSTASTDTNTSPSKPAPVKSTATASTAATSSASTTTLPSPTSAKHRNGGKQVVRPLVSDTPWP